MVGRSYGDAAAPPRARALTPFVGPQRRVLPRGGYRSARNSSTVNPASRIIERSVPFATSL